MPLTQKQQTAAVTKAAESKETAIEAEAAQTTDAGLGGTGATVSTDPANANDGDYTLEIARDNDGTTITATVHGATNADDETFEKAEDLASSTNPGQMLTRTMDADANGDVVTEVAVVYTDIDAPTPTAFAMVEGQALNARDLDPNADGPDGDGDNANDFTALTVDGTSEAVRALVSSAFFAPGAGSSTTLTFAFDDTGTSGTDEADEVAGTYNGAMGTFRCNGSNDCTVTVNAMGMVTAMSDGWIFTPDAGATSDVADANYLHYGFWLKRTTDGDGVVTYNEVETFAGSSIAATTDTTSVTGRATYDGGAAGVYVFKTAYDPGTGDLTDAGSGHFTAEASLMATFGQPASPNDNIPPNELNTITGTIDSFVLSGGEENDWSVDLDGTITPSDATASGTANGEDGSFSANFHGPNVDADSDPIQPHTVVGEFNSTFSNGSVAGAFGARKQ